MQISNTEFRINRSETQFLDRFANYILRGVLVYLGLSFLFYFVIESVVSFLIVSPIIIDTFYKGFVRCINVIHLIDFNRDSILLKIQKYSEIINSIESNKNDFSFELRRLETSLHKQYKLIVKHKNEVVIKLYQRKRWEEDDIRKILNVLHENSVEVTAPKWEKELPR
jgi:hypothetical protein